MNDYLFLDIETTDATPKADSLIETFRALGYNIETAIADLVDNSISACAKEVYINFIWNGHETIFQFMDNGIGMNNLELTEAMRPGSKNPLSERNRDDLGRFGMGLKTASFSQCRHLSVISKTKNQEISYWSWDLDYVSRTGLWNILKIEPGKEVINQLNPHISGTIVQWKKLDRITGSFSKDEKSLKKFLEITENIKVHLGMIFHRFIESKNLKIFFQGNEIAPWNPFRTEESRVQNFPSTSYCEGNVVLKGYVLKHKSAFSNEEFREAGGIRGWNDHQGFYIYRNQRMLVSGSWLGIWAKEEHYKLARISIDISNKIDSEWDIDIKKAIARPPEFLRDQIKKYAADVRATAVNVYRTRSRTVPKDIGMSLVPIWKEFSDTGTKKWSFRINRDHPVIAETLRIAESKPAKSIKLLLRHLEETVPVKSIYIKESEDGYNHSIPFEQGKRDEMIHLMQEVYKTLIDSGLNEQQAKIKLSFLEPFNHYPEEIKNIDRV